MEQKKFYVYMLRCSDQSLYTGYTVNIQQRISAHQRGKGSAYVRSRLPVELVYQEVLPTRQAAMQREAAMKQWPREQKLAFLEQGNGCKRKTTRGKND